MKEPKFTQGEWKAVTDGGIGHEVQANGKGIAWILSGNPADMHLMRSAPELYQELLDRYTQTRCGCGHPACGRCRDDRDTEAVLARARGEETE